MIESRPWAVRPVHVPSTSVIAKSRMTAFIRFCEERTGLALEDPQAFHRFSVTELSRFWSLFLAWSGVLHEGSSAVVVTHCVVQDPGRQPGDCELDCAGARAGY